MDKQLPVSFDATPRRWLKPISACIVLLCLLWAGTALAEFTKPPEFDGAYRAPAMQLPKAKEVWRIYMDIGVFAAALAVGTLLVFYVRSRLGVFLLTVFSIAYFGFYREGCVCAVGSIQNVAASIGFPHAALPLAVGLFFALPLILALFYGRVFCAGVCPLGAIQDVFLWKPISIPNWLEQSLGLLAYAYLGLGVLFAAVGSDFLICRYDPFVAIYRMTGPAYIFVIAGVLLMMSMFIGRTYCRFLCPYSVLLRWLSPFAMRRVTITPTECIDCRLCETSCPFGAIRKPTPDGRYSPKPQDRRRLGVLLGILPGAAAVGAILGFLAGPTLSLLDPTVRLAQGVSVVEKLAKEKKQEPAEYLAAHPDLSSIDIVAYYDTKKPVQELTEKAIGLQNRIKTGSTIFGGYIGAVIVLRLITNSIRRRRTGYTTDSAGCVACARCYSSCPVELQRRGIPLPLSMQQAIALEPAAKPQEPAMV